MILQADIILSNVNDGAQGQSGKDGVSIFKSYAFLRTDSDISTTQPTGGTWDNPVPNGWSDGVPGGTETLWQTVSTFTKDAGGKVTNTPWTKPARVANTSDMLIFYSEITSRPSAPTSNIADGTTWKETATEATIWMAMRVKKDGTWQAWTVTRIKGEKGEDGHDGANGQNAVHYELRDNGSTADIKIENGKIKLTASLSYDLYKVNGTSETKATGTVVNNLDGGSLSYSNAHYTKTITKEYTDIDSLPASVITTAKVNNTVVATAVCKVSMSKKGYFDANTKLGKLTSITTDNKNNISQLQQAAERISAKVGGMANPNLLINSGFTMTSNGIPSYWEVWDDNKAKPAVTINGDNCKVEVKATGMYQGIKQMRKMQLHSPLKLTFSCVAKGSGTLSVMLHKIQGRTQTGDRNDFNLKDSAQSFSCTFELSQFIDSWRVMIGFVSPGVGNNVTFYNPKLEIGDMATQWCENENDRVLATGIDIEKRKVTVTADKFKIIDNAGNDMMSVEKSGASSRLRLRNLAMSGLAIRDMVTMETWEDVRRYFTFDSAELTSDLRFETCLNTFRLSKDKDGKSCLKGKEAGETAESLHMFNVNLPCQDYLEVEDEPWFIEYMEEAMKYVGNRIIILNESGYSISVHGRQEVTHITTYDVWDYNGKTIAKAPPQTTEQEQDLRKTDVWNEGDTYGYYIPTGTYENGKRVYRLQKVWTSEEYWVVPDGSMAIMECVCDICAPYDSLGSASFLVAPPDGQSVFWKVKIGKILKERVKP